MNAHLHIPANNYLSKYIDYFLFLNNDSSEGHYQTFPNTNICLALYRNNTVSWDRAKNACILDEGSHSNNQLFGFHKRPFQVTYRGSVAQICILFKADGLAAFSKIPVNQIDMARDPFMQIFNCDSTDFADAIFSLADQKQQIQFLEPFLANQLHTIDHQKTKPYSWALQQMQHLDIPERKIVARLSDKLGVNPSTLYRNFQSLYGQSPLDMYKTIRFRKTLHSLLTQSHSLTQIAYIGNYFDQSHCIKEFRQLTGHTPGELVKKVNIEAKSFLWVK